MSTRKYAGSPGRLLVICAVLAWLLILDPPRRLPSAVQASSHRKIKRYLTTRRPRVRGPERLRETRERLGPTFVSSASS